MGTSLTIETHKMIKAGTVYGGKHTVTLIPGDGIGHEMANAVKTIFKAVHAPIEWEQFDLSGTTKAVDETLMKQALGSVRRNKVALKGEFKFLTFSK
jgi:isocitrate dehydrogenase (NAD+)